MRRHAVIEQGILSPVLDDVVQSSLFGKLCANMGTSAFLELRLVSKSWQQAILPSEEWATLSLHRYYKGLVKMCTNNMSYPIQLDE